MKSIKLWLSELDGGRYDSVFEWLYKSKTGQAERCKRVLEGFREQFGDKPVSLISAPGRSEIGGNHTDHQHGRVVTAAVTLDALCAAAPNGTSMARLYSEGYGLCEIDVTDTAVKQSELNTTAALLRGVTAGFAKRGIQVSGFDAYLSSDIPKGSGLSSSASLEVAVGTIYSKLFANGAVDAIEIAKIGQLAENEYFGKPSGLLDQMSCSVGGLITVDFRDPDAPNVEKVDFDLAKQHYTLCIVDAGGNHSELTGEYAAIAYEMKQVAEQFGKSYLCEVEEDEFYARLGELRGKVSDRALLRAMHFFGDNARVPMQVAALEREDMPEFLRLVRESGDSSCNLLQNVFPAADISERSVMLALGLSRKLLGGSVAHGSAARGAWRVHGGGFAGTMQAFVPDDMVEEYVESIEAVFGKGKCFKLFVRPAGGYMLEE